MGSQQQNDTTTDDAQGTSGRTGQSLGELTQERGDPSGKRLDLDEPTTAPVQDSNLEEGNAEGEDDEARVGSATTPEATEELSDVARSADFAEPSEQRSL
jgi:hypothetical protein